MDSRRFLIVTGKGGVGKTTVAAAMAVSLASKGDRVLVAMCNAKERLSTMLGSDLISDEISLVAPNIWAVNMNPEKAIEEYGMMKLHSHALYKVLFDNKYVRTFFRAVPGIAEWSMLGKAWFHTIETRDDGSNRFNVVILDAPATGHGLDMLRVPKVILEVVPPGLLRHDAELAWKMFQDPTLAGVVLVTLPEEMPTTETIELAAALKTELNLPIAKVVVNGVVPPLFSRTERETLDQVGALDTTDPGNAAIEAARARATREDVQAHSLARLSKELPRQPSFLPLLFEDAATPSAIADLAKRIM
jgi:anion-transporting  ArsA/GET3 family ATPase